MRNPRIVVRLALTAFVGVVLAACSSDENTGVPPVPTQSESGAPSVSVSPTSPLEGEWHQDFTCEEQVRTFQENLSEQTREQNQALASLAGNDDVSYETLVSEYSREFAWGPNAETATSLTPESLCKGASDRERTIRFQGATVVVIDWDGSWGPARLELVDDHTFTANDGFENFGPAQWHPTARFSFRIDGGTLTIATAGLVDAWAGTALEAAPWVRVN